eukprot:6844818-Prymnesium_polylepis.1
MGREYNPPELRAASAVATRKPVHGVRSSGRARHFSRRNLVRLCVGDCVRNCVQESVQPPRATVVARYADKRREWTRLHLLNI